MDRFNFVKIPSVRVGGAGDQDEPESLERLLDTLEAIDPNRLVAEHVAATGLRLAHEPGRVARRRRPQRIGGRNQI